jgi:MoaA/NifB/PqqE/SkfB family radical SAM enzyme
MAHTRTKFGGQELAELLDEQDQIHFSIDGWDHKSNNEYRINSNWSSIITGVTTINDKSKCYTVWDAIGFKFNEDKIEDMKAYAKELGFDAFQLTKSTKFGKIYEDSYGKDDALQPSDKLLSSSHRFEREVFKLTDKEILEPWMRTNIRLFEESNLVGNERPLCHIGNKGSYINARGEFYPCCWVATRYGHNDKWRDVGKKYNLHEKQLPKVVRDSFWVSEFIHGSYECQNKCAHNRVDKNYATEW